MLGRWSYLAAVLVPLFAILALGLSQASRLDDVRNLIFDSYQRVSPRPWNPQTPVRIVDIDDESLRRIGQWPWPRPRLGELVQRLGQMGVAAIGFDMVFSEADRTSPENVLPLLPETPGKSLIQRELASTPGNDQTFADEIGTAPVVLGSILTGGTAEVTYPVKFGIASAGDDPLAFIPHFSSAVLPLPGLVEKAAGIGALNWLPDRDQTVRRVPLVLRVRNQIVPGLALESLRVAQSASTFLIRASNASGQTTFGARTGINAIKVGAQEIATDPRGEIRVRFSHTEGARFVPAWKLFDGSVDSNEIQGRIILIGTSAAGLLDQRATPVDASVPGVEVHAQLIEHIVEGYSLIRADWAVGLELLIAALAGLAIAILLPRIEAAGTAVLGLAAIATVIGGSWYAFSHNGVLLDPLFPTITVAAVYLSGVLSLYRAEQKQKRWVREAFGRFVAPAVVEQLTKDPERLVLGGETRTITIMFCDIRGFTAISEGMDAVALTTFMNTYLTALSEVCLDHKATLDKYIGDAIMAFWNAPLDDPDHASNAARASLDMIIALAALNARWKAEADVSGRAHKQVRFGIGLATGSCSVGNFGSVRRFDYSAFGDDVNLSSRLEGASKTYGVEILASRPTREAAPDFAWLEVDAVRVKGKTEAVRIFTLVGDATVANAEEFRRHATDHAAMIDAFRSRRFAEAAERAAMLSKSRFDGLSRLYDYYVEVSRKFGVEQPPAEWDGVTEFAHK
ncbi:CHASE2 domain-containing protein [Flaviflagellibacter deserti]|uniref:CHASE2 domain-containing protein n=1 Tax=Flaviflagellibacter deserti TaxID=2267266 RepID=A0ABV9YZ24_9HYPH